MKIQKISHCCLVVNIDGITIITDPGNYSTSQNMLIGIDAILITHEHGYHVHIESVQAILKNNPSAVVIANSAVGKLLDAAGVPHIIIEGRGTGEIKTAHGTVSVEAFDCKHEEIFEEMGQVQNTAYLVGGTFFIPGDAYCDPGKPVEVLALPVAGPWCRLPDTLRYALRMKPAKAFPIHDGAIRKDIAYVTNPIMGKVLKERAGVEFVPIADGAEVEF